MRSALRGIDEVETNVTMYEYAGKRSTLLFPSQMQHFLFVIGFDSSIGERLEDSLTGWNEFASWSHVEMSTSKRVYLTVACKNSLSQRVPMVAEQLLHPEKVAGKRYYEGLMRSHSGFSQNRLSQMGVIKLFPVIQEEDESLVQAVLYPSLHDHPHGHYFLHSGILPSDLQCKVIDPIVQRIEKNTTVPQAQTFSTLEYTSLDALFTKILNRFKEDAASLYPLKLQSNFGLEDLWDHLVRNSQTHNLEGVASSKEGSAGKSEPDDSDGGVQRQKSVGGFRMYHDFGLTGGEAQTRTKSGIARPALKEGNRTDDWVKELFEELSNILRQLGLAWIWEDMPEERIRAFAEELGKGNIIEAIRIAINIFDGSQKSLTGTHFDGKNCRKYPRVLTLSKIVWIVPGNVGLRVTVILYTRKSADDYFSRKQGHLWLIEQCVDILEDPALVPRDRLEISAMIMKHTTDFVGSEQEFESYRLRKLLLNHESNINLLTDFMEIKCHLNPLVFVSCSTSCLAKMMLKFELDYLEVCSVLRAIAVNIERPYYGCVALLEIIATVSDIVDRESKLTVRGSALGLEIAKRTLMIRSACCDFQNSKATTNKGPGYRFGFMLASSSKISLMSTESWNEEVQDIAKTLSKTLLETDSPHIPPRNRAKRAKEYNLQLNKLCKCMKGYGVLAGNHLLAISALLGIVPFWYINECKVNQGGRTMEYFRQKAAAERPDEDFSGERFVGELESAIHQHPSLGRVLNCNPRLTENILCKIARIESRDNPSDSTYHDLLFDGQVVFEAKGSTLLMHQVLFHYDSSNEPTRIEVDGPIVHEWSAFEEQGTPSIPFGRPVSQLDFLGGKIFSKVRAATC